MEAAQLARFTPLKALGEFELNSSNLEREASKRSQKEASNGRGPVKLPRQHRRHYCLCAPGSSPGKTPGDLHEVQMALL
jgi:hypothetical protein